MDPWIIGLVAGAVVLVLMVVLLSVVVKVAARTADTAQQVLVALEELKANTAPLAGFGSGDVAGGPAGAPSPIRESRDRRSGDGAGG